MDKAQFLQKIAEAEKPVVVDFWASWCKPCMVTKPALEKLAKEFEGKIDFLPVNADDSRELLEQFRVYGIPMIIAFRGGKEVGRVMGAHGEYGYRAIFESLAAGREVRFPLTSLDRILRVGAGGFFILFGIAYGNWFLTGVGATLLALGIYDRFIFGLPK